MMDVLVGTTIGLVFSQIFLPPNPLRAIEHATRELLSKLASGFGTSAAALREHDAKKADAALGLVSSAHDRSQHSMPASRPRATPQHGRSVAA